ncbi:DUF5819 family protein [Streptomyces sp. NPDC006687]|uniref:DUF5819 family protein n=1 Tax=unclassified Streptomyces TaxID=2593676 RepID=UPI0033D50283
MSTTEQSRSGPALEGHDGGPESPPEDCGPRRRLGVGTGAFVVLCLATALIHVLVVFLHVAPANAVSQLYSGPVNAWIYPLFEQNWRLFAPDPESVNRKISARTGHAAPDGSVRVSDWFDLSAVDDSAVEHDPFPSHTAQNMLRRAWSSYLEAFGGDDEPHSERAVMMRTYLRNIAADRVAAHRRGSFDSIQLRVVTLPVPAPDAPGAAHRVAPLDTRYLPWWKVAPHGTD